MNSEILNTIVKDSETHFPEESCGLVIDDSIVYPCINCHTKDRKEHFKISNSDYLKASKIGKKITHVYHSHTSWKKEFSILDKMISEEFNIKLILYHCPDKSFLFYDPTGYQNPYIGKRFRWGINDCFSLVKLYYKNELGIDLNEEITKRDKDFFIKNQDFFTKEIYKSVASNNNLIVLNKNTELKNHDIIIFQDLNNNTFHFAVYIDDNTILHVPRHEVSQISLLTEERVSSIFSIVRRKNERIS